MGTSESQSVKSSFQYDERDKIEELFFQLQNKFTETRNTGYLCDKAMIEFFNEDPQLGLAIWNFMKYFSKKTVVELETFIGVCELLCRDPFMDILQENFIHKDKMQLLAFLKFPRFYQSKKTFDAKEEYISYSQGLQYLLTIFRIFRFQQSVDKYIPINQQAARALLDTVFINQFGTIDWWTFMVIVRQQLSFLNPVLKYYFLTKFLRQKVKFHLPKLLDASFLLNKQLVTLLYLSNSYLQNSSKLTLIHSSSLDIGSFSQLSKALLSFNGPTFLLFRFQEIIPQINSESLENSVPTNFLGTGKDYIYKRSWTVGAFNINRWQNRQVVYQGNNECYIFALTPQFKNFFPVLGQQTGSQGINGLESQQYCYLYDPQLGNDEKSFVENQFNNYNNNSGSPAGLGFGGGNDGQFRIWIDSDMKNKSYCSPSDDTYRKGYLYDPNVKVSLSYVEVWGVMKDFKNIDMYRRDDEQSIIQSQNLGRLIQNSKIIADQARNPSFYDSQEYNLQNTNDSLKPETMVSKNISSDYREIFDPVPISNYNQLINNDQYNQYKTQQPAKKYSSKYGSEYNNLKEPYLNNRAFDQTNSYSVIPNNYQDVQKQKMYDEPSQSFNPFFQNGNYEQKPLQETPNLAKKYERHTSSVYSNFSNRGAYEDEGKGRKSRLSALQEDLNKAKEDVEHIIQSVKATQDSPIRKQND